MDLGCLDLGCIERKIKSSSSPDKESGTSSGSGGGSSESLTATSKIGKNKGMKEACQSNLSTLNKCASQIRKPSHRKTSPLNWFPRKKVDSYLKRKIRLLQEIDGMNSTLDETLGDSNPHYSKVLKEKIAVREAATKAMEARKAAMVEASWCKILHAARIECKDAEAQLLEAEKNAADAFEAANSIGVIMYDIADGPQKYYKIETSAAKGGSTTHTVSASFETAFEVDKQVAAAVKVAFTKLANCPSINKDEFRELLRKISQNPDSEENSQEFSEFTSGRESDTGSEFEMGLNEDGSNHKEDLSGMSQMKFQKKKDSEKFNTTNLVQIMLERLKGLREDQLASLATIVATCGLSAALAEGEHIGSVGNSRIDGGLTVKRMPPETELPSLDKFLVKRLTRLEREVLEAKNARKNEAKDGNQQKPEKFMHQNPCQFDNSSDLGTILVKHSSKLEKEKAEARRKNEIAFGTNSKMRDRRENTQAEMPSLDKYLVKHMSRLEKEVEESKNRRNFVAVEGAEIAKTKQTASTIDVIGGETSVHSGEVPTGKENIDRNKTGDGQISCESLDKVLVKRVSKLEKEKMKLNENEEMVMKVKRNENGKDKEGGEESLDQILVKHKSRLEREKMAAAAQQPEGQMGNSLTRREAREKELQDTWGGLSLGNSIKPPHISKLESEKASSENQIRYSSVRKEAREKELQDSWGGLSLGNSIRPHISKLEKEKASSEDQIIHSSVRKEARKKELQDSWGGLSLGNSIRPHVSRLEKDKAAWIKAEDDENRAAMEQL